MQEIQNTAINNANNNSNTVSENKSLSTFSASQNDLVIITPKSLVAKSDEDTETCLRQQQQQQQQRQQESEINNNKSSDVLFVHPSLTSIYSMYQSHNNPQQSSTGNNHGYAHINPYHQSATTTCGLGNTSHNRRY